MSADSADKALVVIPTYNEAENIVPLIEKIFSLPISLDVLIIDDASPDGTALRVKQLQQVYPDRLHLLERAGKQGLGTAYIMGFRYALARGYAYVFEMDADFSHNPEDLPRLYSACTLEGYDVAIGSRYITGVNVVNWPMKRVLLSYFASRYVQWITGMPVQDATAGFKCYRREVLETIDLDRIAFVGYAFQIAIKFQAWKYGFRLKEVPIVFTERVHGQSKMSFRIFKEAFFGVIQMKIESLFRQYRRKLPEHN